MTAGFGRGRLGDYLEHMVEAVALAQEYAQAMDLPRFMADRKTQQAVVFNLMVLGEAATKIAAEYPEFVVAHPEVPWATMRGMRNRMAHGYFAIDMAIVWATVTSSLPALRAQLAALRAD